MTVQFANGVILPVYSAGEDPLFIGQISINFETRNAADIVPVLTMEALAEIIWSDGKQERTFTGYTQIESVMRSPSGNFQMWLSKGAEE